MVVIEQPDALGGKRLPSGVQSLRQVADSRLIAIIKALHAGDDHLIGIILLGFRGHGGGVVLDAAQIHVQADHL